VKRGSRNGVSAVRKPVPRVLRFSRRWLYSFEQASLTASPGLQCASLSPGTAEYSTHHACQHHLLRDGQILSPSWRVSRGEELTRYGFREPRHVRVVVVDLRRDPHPQPAAPGMELDLDPIVDE
jgi:hypothetical protein